MIWTYYNYDDDEASNKPLTRARELKTQEAEFSVLRKKYLFLSEDGKMTEKMKTTILSVFCFGENIFYSFDSLELGDDELLVRLPLSF